MHSFDLVIRGGTIVDGTGAPSFAGDVGIIGDRIAAVGRNLPAGAREIDASGALVTPGFVDVHTHYDGQATWTSRLSPSSYHGVTTALMGNCGVGFAPCRTEDHERLIQLMEGVEDIPEIVMAEGIPWDWESFAQYLDFLGSRQYDMDIASQLPHSALRVFVMGQRAADREEATADDQARMTALVKEAIEAGATGFSTSRSRFHKTGLGDPIPSLGATEEELIAIGEGMRQAGRGLIEVATEFEDIASEMAILRRVARSSGRPITVPIAELPDMPGKWREVLKQIRTANEDGLPMTAQVTARPIGVLMAPSLSCNPFIFCPSYRALDDLSIDDRLAALRDPELRARLISEEAGPAPWPSLERVRSRARRFESMFVLGSPPNYTPAIEDSMANIAAREGRSPAEVAYDSMIREDGEHFLYVPIANFVGNSLDPVHEMLQDENTVVALGDGGAHYGSICDASYPTYMLTYWTKDRAGDRLTVEAAIKALTSDPAKLMGLGDRGTIAVGRKADLNVIDYDRLQLHAPQVEYGLPGDGRYLVQHATGYVATIVSGVVTYREGQATGQLPGRLIRGTANARVTMAA